jgi:multidrug efflux pump subunit AcrA (membrane-fusion protein)
VKVGQPATITQVDTNQSVEGKVTVVSPATDPNSTTFQVWVQAENPGEQLKPGTSVHVAIMTEIIKATPVVPIAAILPGEEGGTACLVITPDGIAHRRSVKLGVREGRKVQKRPPGEVDSGRHRTRRQGQGQGDRPTVKKSRRKTKTLPGAARTRRTRPSRNQMSDLITNPDAPHWTARHGKPIIFVILTWSP